MILHLVHDEKIINRTIDLFETALPAQNVFVVYKREKFNYIRESENVMSVKKFAEQRDAIRVDHVIIHSLNKAKMAIVGRYVDKSVPVSWIIWGVDLYNRLLEPKGYRIQDTQSSYHKSLTFNFLTTFVHRMRYKLISKQTASFIKKRIRYILTDTTENDYDYLLRYYPELSHIPWKEFFYYPVDHVLSEEMLNQSVNGDTIQIGNSGCWDNNHEYAMKILSKLDVRERKVAVPLSYSTKHKKYINSVVQAGESLFRESFVPVTKYMPLADYNRFLCGINVAIYGNWRQQAVGNIIISLYLGAKVFLSSANPVLEWARNHGLVVFELESMTQQDLDNPLSPGDQTRNKQILLSTYNEERLLTLIRETFR